MTHFASDALNYNFKSEINIFYITLIVDQYAVEDMSSKKDPFFSASHRTDIVLGLLVTKQDNVTFLSPSYAVVVSHTMLGKSEGKTFTNTLKY